MRTAGLGLIIKERKIYLLQRSKTCILYPLHWCFPGGRGEKEETPEETAIREVKEETNLNFFNTKLFDKKLVGERDCYYFLGEVQGEIIFQESEVSNGKYFSYKEIKELSIAFNHREIIDKLFENNLIG